jgi:ribosomal protein L20A (L18A)
MVDSLDKTMRIGYVHNKQEMTSILSDFASKNKLKAIHMLIESTESVKRAI